LGAPLHHICAATASLHAPFPNLGFVYPVHPNPNVSEAIEPLLSPLERVHLIGTGASPDDNRTAPALPLHQDRQRGLQEGGSALGKPVVILQAETARPEGVLAGTDAQAIVTEAPRLL